VDEMLSNTPKFTGEEEWLKEQEKIRLNLNVVPILDTVGALVWNTLPLTIVVQTACAKTVCNN
jgi:hypothetical protein